MERMNYQSYHMCNKPELNAGIFGDAHLNQSWSNLECNNFILNSE